jgi:hypothetical protein
MNFIIGTDAGGWEITVVNGKVVLKRIPGWNPEQLLELTAALNVIREATKLRTPGLAEEVAGSVMKFAQGQLGQHVHGEGTVIVVG